MAVASAGTQFSLVLLGRFAGRDKPVAAALARHFGLDDTWGLQIVGAAPIVLLDGLSGEQAQAVRTALADVESAGSKIEVRAGTDPELSKVGWPAPPRIEGRLVSEYAATGASGATATLLLPCPYTGQKLRLTISVSVEQVAEQGAAITVAAVPAVPSHVAGPPIPVPHPSAAASRPAPGTGMAPAYRPVPTPMCSPAVALPRPRSARLGAAPAAGPVPSTAPLPDVPVLHNPPAPPAQQAAAEAVASPGQATMPQDLMGTPMDLAAFEAGVSASGILGASPEEADSGAAGDSAPAETSAPAGQAPAANAATGNGALWSVFMGKSANPKVHQAIAELQGIPVADAAKLCQKPVLGLAKDVTIAQARSIKQQFAALNVPVRMTKRS